MKMNLAENIKTFRKSRNMTQEQLAEILGVTVGAVHKWENRLSTPELSLIIEMADLFDVSVDVLIGYEMKDNRIDALAKRLLKYISSEDRDGLREAEKALRRFPNSFNIVYVCAVMFMIFGGKDNNETLLKHASELLERSLILLPQNTNPAISEIGIYEYMSTVRIMLGQGDRAAELLKEHNSERIYSDQIGFILSLISKRPADAQPYLSESLIDSITKMIRTVIGKAYAYIQSGDNKSAEKILIWELENLESLKQSETTGILDQPCSYLYAMLSYVYLKNGHKKKAGKALSSACEMAKRFDQDPTYDAGSIPFIGNGEHFEFHFILGSTALESIAHVVKLIGDDSMTDLWKEISENE